MNNEYIQKMRDAALVASSIVAQTAAQCVPGRSLNALDGFAARLIDELKAEPYNLGYKPDWAATAYPAVLCTSVNDEVAHGIPNDYKLQEGDTICIDLGIKFNGVCGDCAVTVPVGKIDKKTELLLKFANRACYVGIQAVKPGVAVTEISKVIEKYAKDVGYVTNMRFSGHSIGDEMHGRLTIPFFYSHESKFIQQFGTQILKPGDVICLEPMLTKKDRFGYLTVDGWTVKTKDKERSAMFEHMILVTETGYEVLTDHFVKA